MFTNTQPKWIHSIQKCLIQHAYTKKFDYTICFKENTHQELQQNVQRLSSTRGIGNTHYSIGGGEKRE